MHVPASVEQMSELDMASPAAIKPMAGSASPLRVSASPRHRVETFPEGAGRYRQGQEDKTLFDRIEAFVSRLSVRDNFWHSICSLIWLPLAFFSGIRMKQIDATTFSAVLPFRRFNRNWYRAMAGGALLANSEIAGGMYVFGICGGNYTVVCKHLEYKFLRPCFGPAVYRMTPRENIRALTEAGGEFNVTLDLEVQQQGFRGEHDRRVGQSVATFHVTPKSRHKARKARKRG